MSVASPCAANRACSSSRFAWMLVSGVRSSCEASATNSRWACTICSVSERAASSWRSMSSSVRASSATSSSVSGIGIRREGSRVVATSRAAAVSEAIGRIARPATARPASSCEGGAGEDARTEQEPDPVRGRFERVAIARVLDEDRLTESGRDQLARDGGPVDLAWVRPAAARSPRLAPSSRAPRWPRRPAGHGSSRGITNSSTLNPRAVVVRSP